MLECVRCKGTGKVRKYLNDGCKCIELFYVASVLIGSIIGIISYILLIKNILSGSFLTIFYFLGASAICSILSHNSFENVLREKEILFKNISDSPLLLILIIFLSYINTKFGKYLISSDKIFINVINIIYSIIQASSIIFMVLIILDVRDIKVQIECPLCLGNKFIEERIFREIERCKFCSKGCGYEGGKCCSDRREFCHVCKGKGFNFKNY